MGWSIELREFDIEYFPRKAVKGKALEDFLQSFQTSTQKLW